MIKKIVSCIIVFYSLSCFAQDFPPTLTKQKMYEDFDEFIHILQEANPQLPVRKVVTGYDQLDSVKLLRSAIDTIEDYYRFIGLLDHALGYMYDIHAVMAKQVYEQWDDTTEMDIKMVSEIYTKFRQRGIELYMKGGGPRWFPCNPSYIDGNYYIHGFITLTSRDGDTLVLKNVKIISHDNIPYNEYVLKSMFRFQNSVRWDFKRNQYYSTASSFLKKGELVIEDENGNIDTVNLDMYYGTHVQQFSDTNLFNHLDFKLQLPTEREKRVFYFEQDKILYIYLNDMNDTENKFIEKVKEVGRNKELKKVIIDVRGNRGGGDPFWNQLLKTIVADSLIYDVQMAFCNSELMRKRLGKHAESSKVQTFEWLPNTEFLLTQYVPSYFVPDANSFQYKGKIYVLQDEEVFSAGHSLTSYCRHIEQLVSVGEPTGLLAGFGLAPLLYQLKNSKFSFRLEPAIDVTKVNSAIDVYQCFPEIVIEFPFEEKIKALDYKMFDMQNETCLYKYDYLFKKVLEME